MIFSKSAVPLGISYLSSGLYFTALTCLIMVGPAGYSVCVAMVQKFKKLGEYAPLCQSALVYHSILSSLSVFLTLLFMIMLIVIAGSLRKGRKWAFLNATSLNLTFIYFSMVFNKNEIYTIGGLIGFGLMLLAISSKKSRDFVSFDFFNDMKPLFAIYSLYLFAGYGIYFLAIEITDSAEKLGPSCAKKRVESNNIAKNP